MSTLTVRGLSVAVEKRALLGDVNFDLNPGEMVGLIGPNGAGKTTCLRAITGLQEASGEVALDGRARSAFSPREWARQVSYLPQARAIAWPLTARNVVALGAIRMESGRAMRKRASNKRSPSWGCSPLPNATC